MKELQMAYDRKGRYYFDPDHPERKMYSVSTIIKWGAPKGKTSDSAKIGSIIHYNILRNYTDEFIEVPMDMPYWTTPEEVTQKIDDAMTMWFDTGLEDVVEDWLGVEKAIYFDGKVDGVGCWYAGRLDALAKCKDGKIRLIDLKSGDSYEDHEIQMGGYVQAVEYCMGVHVDEVYIVYLDIGSNYVKETKTRVERNVGRLARIKVIDRPGIEEGIKEFNEKLVWIFREFN